MYHRLSLYLRIYMRDDREGRKVGESRFSRALAGLCLAAAVAGGAAIVAGGSTAGATALIVAPSPTPSCPAQVRAPPYCLNAHPDDTKVQLVWLPAAKKGFVVYFGTNQSIGNATKFGDAIGTDATVTGLINGTTYYFWLVEGKLPNAVSNMASATPAARPGTPTGLTAKPGNTQVTLSWTAPASGGGSLVSGYNVFEGTTADLSRTAPVTNVTGTTVTLPALINGTRYYFEVTAVNGIGEGPPSNEVSAVPLTVPGAPTGLTATPGNSRVTLSWSAPASGGAAISGYLIFEGTRPGGENRNPVNGSLVTATSYPVSGLTNGITYYFRVIAVNAAGQGPLSAEAPTTLLRIPPTSPPPSTPTSGTTAQKVSAPTGLTATAGDTQVHLSWTAPASDGASVISYKVYLASLPGVQESAAIGTSKTPDATVGGLTNGTVYYFMVAAVNAAGNQSPLSAEVTAEPTGSTPDVPLPSPGPPKWLIAMLAAAAAIVAAGALTLIRRRSGARRPADRAHAREQIAIAQDVRAVPDTARPDMVSVHDTGREPTHTVRLEPHPGTITTTIKEGRP